MRNKDHLMNSRFSYFDAPVSNIVPAKEITLYELVEILCNKDLLEQKTIALRAITTDKAAYGKLKIASLPYVTFSGTFTRRNNLSLIKHSGQICIDLDHLGVDLPKVKAKIEEDLDHVLMAFISPSGDGLKVIYPINMEKMPQEQWVQHYEAHIRKITGIPELLVDSACKDVARACLIPYAEKPFVNPRLGDQSETDIVPIKVQENSQTSYESYEPYSGPTIDILALAVKDQNLDFSNLNSEENFLRLYKLTTKRKGEYKRPRKIWIFQLAVRCNLFGMSEAFCRECAVKFLSAHPNSSDESDPFNVTEHIANPIKKTYQTYQSKHGTWTILETSKFETPELPQQVYMSLPWIIDEGSRFFHERHEKDIFLLSLLTVLSSCMPNVSGRYDSRLIQANLYLMVIAPAASGKSTMRWARNAIKYILMQQKQEYEADIQAYKCLSENKSGDGPKPPKPIRKSHLIPGNISAPAIIQALEENSGRGLIFETEADTVANTMKNDWGDYSDFMRKAFHHEHISFRRRHENEHVEIESPFLSALLSGTPDQPKSLLRSVENGLVSRFLFYNFKGNIAWKDVFQNNLGGSPFINYMESDLPGFASTLNERCKTLEDVEFRFTVYQQDKFNEVFGDWLLESEQLLGEDCVATIKRLAIIHFRIAMILTVVRQSSKLENSMELSCSKEDFETALLIVDSLKLHAFKIISEMKRGTKDQKAFSNGQQKAYYLYLPKSFTRATADAKAKALRLNLKTAEKYIEGFVDAGTLERPRHGEYVKTNMGLTLTP